MTNPNLSNVEQLVWDNLLNLIREKYEIIKSFVNRNQAEIVEANQKLEGDQQEDYQEPRLSSENTDQGVKTQHWQPWSWTFNRELIVDVGSKPDEMKNNEPASDRELEWSISDEKAKRFIVNCVKESPIMGEIRKEYSLLTPKEINAMIERLVIKAVKVLNEENNGKCIVDVHVVNEAEIKEKTRKTTREIHFVIDESGSMIGDKMEDTKRCLKALVSGLEEQSSFQIYGFGTTFHRCFENGPQSYDEQSRAASLDFINKMDAKLGGTDLLGPLKDIFTGPLKEDVVRLIFVITDGYVDDLDAVVNLVRRNKMHNYIFSVGIGDDVCEILVRYIAEESSGKFVIVRESEGLLSYMDRLFNLALEAGNLPSKVNKKQVEIVEANENLKADHQEEYQVAELFTDSTAEIAAVYLNQENDQSNSQKNMVTKIIEEQNADGSWTFNRRLIFDVGSNPDEVKNKQPEGLSQEGWMTTLMHSAYATKASGRELEWCISDEKAKQFIVKSVSPIMAEIHKGNSLSKPKDINAMLEDLVNNAVKILNEENNEKCIIDVQSVNAIEIKEKTRKTKREIHFIIDESESMNGGKIEDAKRCLKGLISGIKEQSTFQIYGFGTVFDKFFKNGPQLYEDRKRDSRLNYINKMEANLGGTNLFRPLQDIFNVSLNQNVLRLIFVITDGCVDDLEEVVNLIKRNRMHNYVFSVGIGDDVCLDLVRRIAEESSGNFVLVKESEGLLSSINRLLKVALAIDE